jgi:hypothetical protein
MKVLYSGFGLQLGNLVLAKVLDNFNRRVRFPSERDSIPIRHGPN